MGPCPAASTASSRAARYVRGIGTAPANGTMVHPTQPTGTAAAARTAGGGERGLEVRATPRDNPRDRRHRIMNLTRSFEHFAVAAAQAAWPLIKKYNQVFEGRSIQPKWAPAPLLKSRDKT